MTFSTSCGRWRRRTWSGEIGERGSLAAAAEKTRESRSGIAGTGGEGRNRAEASTDASGGHEASGDADLMRGQTDDAGS